jgi:hypothetical protein
MFAGPSSPTLTFMGSGIRDMRQMARPRPPWPISYGSDPRDAKSQRRLAKAALAKGEEPEPEYRTGRFWTD